MKLKNRTSWSLFLATLSVGFLQAQQSAVASGGNASGVGGTVSYSVGQVLYTTASGVGGSVVQIFKQPIFSFLTTYKSFCLVTFFITSS